MLNCGKSEIYFVLQCCGSAYLQSMDCQREPQSKHPTGENPGVYTVDVRFLVLFQKTDRAILVLATFHRPCCTADDLAFSNCRILTTKSCFKVLLFYDMKSYCHRSRAVVLYSCVMADYIASNNCKIKECLEAYSYLYTYDYTKYQWYNVVWKPRTIFIHKYTWFKFENYQLQISYFVTEKLRHTSERTHICRHAREPYGGDHPTVYNRESQVHDAAMLPWGFWSCQPTSLWVIALLCVLTARDHRGRDAAAVVRPAVSTWFKFENYQVRVSYFVTKKLRQTSERTHISAAVIPGGKHTQQSNDPERSRLATSETPQQHSSIVHLKFPVIYGGMVAPVWFPCMSTDMCPFWCVS